MQSIEKKPPASNKGGAQAAALAARTATVVPAPIAAHLEKLIALAESDTKIMSTIVSGLGQLVANVATDAVKSATRSSAAKKADIRARNAVALGKMEDASFKKLSEIDKLLTAEEVQAILNVGTRQAISRRLKTKTLLGYKYKSNVYYPSFQFAAKGVNPLVIELWKSVATEGHNDQVASQMNGFIRFLEGEENHGGVLRQRYELLNTNSMDSIRSQYINRNKMGQ